MILNRFRGYTSYIYILAILSISLFFNGCKKEEDTSNAPVVNISQPINGEIFEIGDTLKVLAVISHDRIISRVSFSVVDMTQKPVISGKSLKVDNNTFTLNSSLKIDNRYLEESKYFLLIKVEDDKDLYNFWQEIQIRPLDRFVDKLLIVNGSEISFQLTQINGGEEPVTIHEINYHYLKGFADTRYSRFYASSNEPSILSAIDLQTSDVLWDLNLPNSVGTPFIQKFSAIDGRISIGTSEGFIESYNHQGQMELKAKVDGIGLFTEILNYGSFVITSFKQYNSNLSTLYVFNFPAGTVFFSTQISGDVKGILPFGEEEVVVVMENTPTESKSMILNLPQKQLSLLHQMSISPIDAIKGNYNDLFVQSGDTIYWYKPQIGSVVPYITNQEVSTLAYDEIDSRLYVGSTQKVLVYQLPYSSISETFQFINPIKEINLLYNKK